MCHMNKNGNVSKDLRVQTLPLSSFSDSEPWLPKADNKENPLSVVFLPSLKVSFSESETSKNLSFPTSGNSSVLSSSVSFVPFFFFLLIL